jgi:hypothetical protein
LDGFERHLRHLRASQIQLLLLLGLVVKNFEAFCMGVISGGGRIAKFWMLRGAAREKNSKIPTVHAKIRIKSLVLGGRALLVPLSPPLEVMPQPIFSLFMTDY